MVICSDLCHETECRTCGLDGDHCWLSENGRSRCVPRCDVQARLSHGTTCDGENRDDGHAPLWHCRSACPDASAYHHPSNDGMAKASGRHDGCTMQAAVIVSAIASYLLCSRDSMISPSDSEDEPIVMQCGLVVSCECCVVKKSVSF